MHREATLVACHHFWGRHSLPHIYFCGRAVGGYCFSWVEKKHPSYCLLYMAEECRLMQWLGNAQIFFKSPILCCRWHPDSTAVLSVQLWGTFCPELKQTCCVSGWLDNFSGEKLSPQIRLEGYYCISQQHPAFEMPFPLVLGVLGAEASQEIGISIPIISTSFGKRHL